MKLQYQTTGRWVILLLLSAAMFAEIGCSSTQNSRSTGAYIDDSATTAKVKTALFRDPLVSGFDVNVTTYRGEVQLSGFVDTQEQKARAAQLASSVEGVQNVVNNLDIKPTAVGGPAPGTSGTANQPELTPVPDSNYPANSPGDRGPTNP